MENVDHAARLLRRLKGWPIVADPVLLKQSLSADVRQALEAGQEETKRRTADVIVTPRGMKSAGVFDVLIRADAGTGLPPFADSFFVARDGRDEPIGRVTGRPDCPATRKVRLSKSGTMALLDEPAVVPGVNYSFRIFCTGSIGTMIDT